jgi:hypothetical protein
MRWTGYPPENSKYAESLFRQVVLALPAWRSVLVTGGWGLVLLALGVGAYFLFPRSGIDRFGDISLVEKPDFWIRSPAGYLRNLVGVDQIAMQKFEIIAPVNSTDRWSMRGVVTNNARFPIDEVTVSVYVYECGDPADGCLLTAQDRQARINLGHVEPGAKKDFYQFVDIRPFGRRNENYFPATDKWIMSFLVRRVRAPAAALSDIARATQKRD